MKRITLFSIFERDTLRSRESVKSIFSNVKNTKVILDFDKIDFISNSFANELLHEIKNRKLDVEYVNISDSIKKMLEISQRKLSTIIKIPNRRKTLSLCRE